VKLDFGYCVKHRGRFKEAALLISDVEGNDLLPVVSRQPLQAYHRRLTFRFLVQ
jgi:hypothetical protein